MKYPHNIQTKRICSLLIVVALLCLQSFSQASDLKVDRIIALSPHSVELLFLLGAGDKIVATTSFADYPEAAKAIPIIGGYNGIQIEKVLSLKPDLVIAWEGGNKLDDIAQLERLGMNVYRSHTSSLSEIADEILSLGNLIGVQKKAKEEAEKFLSGLLDLKKQYADKQAVRFFYQLWSEPLRAMAAKSWINEILTGCGGKNIFDASISDYPQVSIENILKEQPDVIIIPSHHGDGLGEGDFWQKWPEIPAVKNNRIFYVDGDLLHRFSVRTLDGMKVVCEYLEGVRTSK
jgi:vitamin B12 transport system substrate-binding protein